MGRRIQTEPLSMDALLSETQSPEAGALAVFAGTVRRENEGREVTAIEYTAYEPLAERQLDILERETERDFDITCCRIRHRIGPLALGDASVLIVVRAPHRAEAFAAARHAIDTLKHTVPIWKRESYADGTQNYLHGNTLLPDDPEVAP